MLSNREGCHLLLHTTFWTFPNFSQLSPSMFDTLNHEALQDDLVNLFQSVEARLFQHNVFNFLGYADHCALTAFVDSLDAKIATVQFGCRYRSPDISQFPHVISVDIFLCDRNLDFAAMYHSGASHDGSSKTIHLL